MTREERLKHARDFVNARRREVGLRATSRLSKGYRTSVHCPIANSLEKVGVIGANYEDGKVWLFAHGCRGRSWRDTETALFMKDFDNGLYPELEKPGTPVKINKKVIS